MRYPLTPRERTGIVVICVVILLNIGWLVWVRNCHRRENGRPVERVFYPESIVDEEPKPDSTGDSVIAAMKSQKGRSDKNIPKRDRRKKSKPKSSSSNAGSVAPRNFLRDTIPTNIGR